MSSTIEAEGTICVGEEITIASDSPITKYTVVFEGVPVTNGQVLARSGQMRRWSCFDDAAVFSMKIVNAAFITLPPKQPVLQRAP